ncbi:MAG: DUF499 domain-containing protein [Deltaproteobacteria bacterium]|nr:DUF499 domain-containing protein [Deltaproteobacteria bacterium]
MKAFHTIAVPHKDILEGNLTMDVFAADLWQVSRNRGPDEYKDSDLFFGKTYLTQGLENLLTIVEKRLKGKGGDSVIQIQTPFGGGKTHALIAMYHKAASWKVKTVVISGTALGADQTLWSLIEKQLAGKVSRFSGKGSPGKEAILDLLSEHQPVLILIDEVLEYATKAAAVKVEASNLAAQTSVFIKDLTEAVGNVDKACLLLTLPSSIITHYDEQAEKLYQQLQMVSGRVEKIYTPVQDNEVVKVIRRRLFGRIDEKAVKSIVTQYIDYAEKEGILPSGVQSSEYRDRFIDSYPFMPEVVDILYHRWGSFPTFQRTRGVLRLLSLVIYSQKDSNKPYIGLGDFDLSNQELRQEFIKHIGSEFNTVVAADITDQNSGAKKIDSSLGKSYQGLHLGTRTANAIFLYSFSGGREKGTTAAELKRAATTVENPASVVAEAVEQLKGKLFYLQSLGDKYFFSNQPNLNRIRLTKMDNIKNQEVTDIEKELLVDGFKGSKLKAFAWEEKPGDISDIEEHKLVILKKKDDKVMENIHKNKGLKQRVYNNTLFFLYPLESERAFFENTVKMKLACEYIDDDKTLNLSEDQKKENKKELKKSEERLTESIRRLYRLIAVPGKEGFREIDLGIPTYGESKSLHQEIYEKLRSDGEILENIAPLVLKEKYLGDKDHVLTEQIYQSLFRTPGETRLANKDVLEQCVVKGVQMGLFGLGEMQDGKPFCRFYKENCSPAFSGKEIIIAESLCKKTEQGASPEPEPPTPEPHPEPIPPIGGKKEVRLRFKVPKGKVSNIMGIMNFLQSKFNSLEIELTATDGKMTEQEFEDKIEETFRQLGIKIK